MDGLSFQVDVGRVCGFLGRNGAGKTTTIRMLVNLMRPSTGLDPIVRRDFLEGIIQLIQEEGRTVLFSSHLVHEVERVADQIVVIEAGKLVTSESVESLKRGTMSLEEAFVERVGRREPAKEAAQ